MTATTAPPATFNWDELVPAIDAPAPKTTGGRTDVRSAIHPAIRKRAEESLGQSVAAIVTAKTKGTKEENVPPQWKLQPMPNHAAAAQFAKDLKRYAQNRPGSEEITAESPLEFYVVGSPVGQVTARAAVVVIKTDDTVTPARVTTEAATEAHKSAPEGTHQFGVRYAVKPLEKRNPTVANGDKHTGNADASK